MASVNKYDGTYLECRVLGHAWDPNDMPLIWREGHFHLFEETLTCLRCKMERQDTYAGSLLLKRKYQQPQGYRIKGATKQHRQRLRDERMKRRRRNATKISKADRQRTI